MTSTRRGSKLDAIFAAGRRRSRMLRRNGILLLIAAGILSAALLCVSFGSDWTFYPFHRRVLLVIGFMAGLALLLLVGSRWVESADRRYTARQVAERNAFIAARRAVAESLVDAGRQT